MEDEPAATTVAWHAQYTTFKRWGTAPWSGIWLEFLEPLSLFLDLPVLLPTLAYSVAFAYCAVLLTVRPPPFAAMSFRGPDQTLRRQKPGRDPRARRSQVSTQRAASRPPVHRGHPWCRPRRTVRGLRERQVHGAASADARRPPRARDATAVRAPRVPDRCEPTLPACLSPSLSLSE